MVGAVVRSLPSNHKVPGSNPGSAFKLEFKNNEADPVLNPGEREVDSRNLAQTDRYDGERLASSASRCS